LQSGNSDGRATTEYLKVKPGTVFWQYFILIIAGDGDHFGETAGDNIQRGMKLT